MINGAARAKEAERFGILRGLNCIMFAERVTELERMTQKGMDVEFFEWHGVCIKE